jgi:hypothetical protein
VDGDVGGSAFGAVVVAVPAELVGRRARWRWSDLDLRAKTLTVSQARVLVDYKVRIEPPKSP